MIRKAHDSRNRIGPLAALGLALFLAAAASDGGRAQEPGGAGGRSYGEYAIKAAFLYNVAKFTQWPVAAQGAAVAPLRICVLGRDPFGATLDAIGGRRIQGRDVATARVAGLAEARSCQILFISASEAGRVGAILAELGRDPILTVTDMSRPSAIRGIIHLETVARKLRFAIDADSAGQAGLRFSAKLLSLAGMSAGQASAVPARSSGLAEPNG
jgi:hypothetical protein